MKRVLKPCLRNTAVVFVVFFGVMSVSAPAFSWQRHPASGRPGGYARVHISGGSAIPAIIATGIIAGITFSLIDDAVSTPATQCVVVPQSTTVYGSVSPQVVSTGSVVVTAQLLNVRSGPSLANPAIRQIPNGTVLSVCGNAPGWYYVKMADSLHGWVMIQYTAPVGYPASG
jgi:uncharacterized protein YgiM (DUF1202 family)